MLVIVSFGTLTLLHADAMARGGPVAGSVAAVIAVFWGARPPGNAFVLSRFWGAVWLVGATGHRRGRIRQHADPKQCDTAHSADQGAPAEEQGRQSLCSCGGFRSVEGAFINVICFHVVPIAMFVVEPNAETLGGQFNPKPTRGQ